MKKLDDVRHGPFEIVEKVGASSYKLKIPKTWKRIHDVFNEVLLTPYHEPQFPNQPRATKPPPEVVGEELEYEVEKIVDSRLTRNKRGVQYLVKFKGWPSSSNEWINSSLLPNAQEAIEEFHERRPQAVGPKVRILSVPGEDTPKEGVLSWDDHQESPDSPDSAVGVVENRIMDLTNDGSFWKMDESLDWARESDSELYGL